MRNKSWKKVVLASLCSLVLCACTNKQVKKTEMSLEYEGTCDHVLKLARDHMIKAQEEMAETYDKMRLEGISLAFGEDHKCLSKDEVAFWAGLSLKFMNEDNSLICGTTYWLIYGTLDKNREIIVDILKEEIGKAGLCEVDEKT